jgi:hypothetical protein
MNIDVTCKLDKILHILEKMDNTNAATNAATN